MAVFLNYRRNDSTSITGRIDDHLRDAFGCNGVYRDIDSIPPGVDFTEHIKLAISACNICVAVVGPRWLSERLHRPNDFVRVELEIALERKIPVIPVLVENAELPPADQLPPSLQPLLRRQAIRIDSGADFKTHVQRLIEAIRTGLEKTTPWYRRRVPRITALTIVCSIVILPVVGRFLPVSSPLPVPSASPRLPTIAPASPERRLFVSCPEKPPTGALQFERTPARSVAVSELCRAGAELAESPRYDWVLDAAGARLSPPNPFYTIKLAVRDNDGRLSVGVDSPKTLKLRLLPCPEGARLSIKSPPVAATREPLKADENCTFSTPLPVEAWGLPLELSFLPATFQADPVTFDALEKSVAVRRPALTVSPDPCQAQCLAIRACRREREANRLCGGLRDTPLHTCTSCSDSHPKCQGQCP